MSAHKPLPKPKTLPERADLIIKLLTSMGDDMGGGCSSKGEAKAKQVLGLMRGNTKVFELLYRRVDELPMRTSVWGVGSPLQTTQGFMIKSIKDVVDDLSKCAGDKNDSLNDYWAIYRWSTGKQHTGAATMADPTPPTVQDLQNLASNLFATAANAAKQGAQGQLPTVPVKVDPVKIEPSAPTLPSLDSVAAKVPGGKTTLAVAGALVVGGFLLGMRGRR